MLSNHPNFPSSLSDDPKDPWADDALAPSPCELPQIRGKLGWELKSYDIGICGVLKHIYKDLGIYMDYGYIYIYDEQNKTDPKHNKSVGVTCFQDWLTARQPQTLELPTTRVHKIVSTYMVLVLIEWVHGAQWGWLIQLEAGSFSNLPWNAAILELTARHHGGQFLQ